MRTSACVGQECPTHRKTKRYHLTAMKIYTKTGDDGTTGLLGSGARRVRKSELRIDCYGNVDELNAFVGWATTAAKESTLEALHAVQADLFVIGSHLAVADGAPPPSSLPTL